MNEAEARKFIEDRKECYDPCDQETYVYCEGYLAAIEKAKGLEEALKLTLLELSGAYSKDLQHHREIGEAFEKGKEALTQWEKTK